MSIPDKTSALFFSLLFAAAFLIIPHLAFASAPDGKNDIVAAIGITIIAATAMAYIGHMLKQPLLLAYIAAGILIGPYIGFGLIKDVNDIETISHFGLILLLFLIGLEIDIKKLRDAGKSLIATGLLQFPLSMLIGVGFFLLLGYSFESGKYDLLYLAACCGLSSTAIVVKLLYGKFELNTLAGRITLGILVFQDIWAILLLGIQPNLANAEVLPILLSFGKGILLVLLSLAASKFILPRLFKSIAKIPELVLISSLAWCFLICGVAAFFELSVEMGALIAGVALSTFPYNLDVIAKVVNIRDFFVTLFFVSLGMQIPNPMDNLSILTTAAIASVFLIASRYIVIFPVLNSLKNGLRVSLLTPTNLSQISEFSLVIATLGVAAGHISRDTLSVIVFVFVITSVLSTYMIKYNDSIQQKLSRLLKKMGVSDIQNVTDEDEQSTEKEIALLGFHHSASSLLHEILTNSQNHDLKEKLLVIDFNPEVHKSLKTAGVEVMYGDISHLDTLHHAGIHDMKIVISTIPDTILVGTDNLKIIRHMKALCPHAKIIVTSESPKRALQMYEEGADYVFLPRILSARNILSVLGLIENSPEEFSTLINTEIQMLKVREEVLH